ncbi:MAG TPA: aminotransferase class I/II-fold pyridoxal phosphate-dependent enzyme [Thermoanaerobaculia bacterium]|jgi:aspartate aminotransferase|nr:aminotransferase class I/II-fold pyridoxal phosphate-dependent enzyme [Thermoanaerobaculia bacterium]
MPIQETCLDLAAIAKDAGPDPAGRISTMAAGLVGSEILRIAGEIRAFVATGRSVCNLTVGDFDPRYFPIPAKLSAAVQAALERGETNYPPSEGIGELRQAVRRFYERDLGLRYPVESVLIVAGARPVIYCIFRTVCDPGDRVIYPVPSWNNNHYVHLVGGVGVPVWCGPEKRFLPTREDLLPLLPGARLLCLNSPLNPSGTAFTREALLGICEAILEENEARTRRGERPLFLLYDHIYWMLRFGDVVHVTPPELLPEMARYTLFVDGISKGFAATGLRVGWGVGPVDVISRMSAVLGHVGAWAPRAEQVATVALLDDAAGIREFQDGFKRGLQERLDLLHGGLQAMKARGLPVDSIPPMGAIYLTARVHPFGRRTPEGTELLTNRDVRRYLLEHAGIGVVPFQAFGSTENEGWFRLSIGAVSLADIEAALPRLEEALRRLSFDNP